MTVKASDVPGSSSGGGSGFGSTPDPVLGNGSGPTQNSFTYFPMYVLDVNNGVVLFPGVDQLAEPAASVYLQAQVSGTTVSSYNWITSGITSDAKNITGASTYQLSFQWNSLINTSHVDAITLAVTDTNSHTETYTYDFDLQSGNSSSSGGSELTWPQSYAPDTVSPDDPAWASDGVSVDSNSGSLDTSIALPSYNPNVAANALDYDSISANPLPVIVAENTLSASQAVPSQVSATLTFNSTVGTTYYYNTSTLNPGDVQQIALQATGASTLATGRYSYSVQIVDHGTTLTTITASGTATLINESAARFGDGWSLDGLEQIFPETGGVILSLGGGNSLWYTGSFGSGGGTYTNPPGQFDTLVKNSNGSYTDTLTDGTQVTFNSGGYETATIDLNSQHVTFSYNGSNEVTSIKDNYSNLTTFSYSGSNLSTIKDPAGRLTTFTFSSGSLNAVQQADGSHVSYTYDSAGRMTHVKTRWATGSRSRMTRPREWERSRARTSPPKNPAPSRSKAGPIAAPPRSPAPRPCCRRPRPLTRIPTATRRPLRPDWFGLGVTGVAVDALGNVATYDLNSNGLPTVTIDQVNRMTIYGYDSLGNISALTNPDGTTQSYIYNSYSEPIVSTNEEGGVTTADLPLFGAIPNGTFFPPSSFFYCPVLIASAHPRLERRVIPDPFRGGFFAC